jgi:DNA polymerase III epsilon subunit-like protein
VVEVRLGVTPLAVVDLECTGLHPSWDRIVEIAVVRLTPSGDIENTWSTLVNPQRDPGPTFAHGLVATDLVKAPLFSDIADELEQRVDGAVLAAHNVNFDFNFLRFEFARLERYVPQWPQLCTVRAANRLGRATQARSRSLVDLCALEGIPHPPGAHTALGDATATARLVRVYLHYAARFGFDYPDLGVRPVRLPVSHAPAVGATKALGRIV